MSRFEHIASHVAILGILGGSLVSISLGIDSFPFSSYPMYARILKFPYESGKLYGVLRTGSEEREIILEKDADLFPFTERTLSISMSRLLKEIGRPAAETVLKDLLGVYNSGSVSRSGRKLTALRYYATIIEPAGAGKLRSTRGKLLAGAVAP